MTDDRWRTSSYSGGSGGNCVEISQHAGHILVVRDSKDRDGVTLRFVPDAWRSLVNRVKNDQAAR